MPEAKDTTKSPTRKTGVVQAGQANIEGSSSAAQGCASVEGGRMPGATTAQGSTSAVGAGIAATKKNAAPKTPKKPVAAAKTSNNKKPSNINPEERYRMIAVAAYYRAEKRGFIGGDPSQDWVEAEAEVNQLINP
jgi:hypothetical protein